jgi:hypothetical protein
MPMDWAAPATLFARPSEPFRKRRTAQAEASAARRSRGSRSAGSAKCRDEQYSVRACWSSGGATTPSGAPRALPVLVALRPGIVRDVAARSRMEPSPSARAQSHPSIREGVSATMSAMDLRTSRSRSSWSASCSERGATAGSARWSATVDQCWSTVDHPARCLEGRACGSSSDRGTRDAAFACGTVLALCAENDRPKGCELLAKRSWQRARTKRTSAPDRSRDPVRGRRAPSGRSCAARSDLAI